MIRPVDYRKVTSVTENLTRKLDTSSPANRSETTEERIYAQLDQASTELTALFTANTKMMSDQLDQTSTEVTNTFADTAVRVGRQVGRQRAHDPAPEKLHRGCRALASAGNSMFTRGIANRPRTRHALDIATEIPRKVTSDVSGRIPAPAPSLLKSSIPPAAK
jgi:hypothetical protein